MANIDFLYIVRIVDLYAWLSRCFVLRITPLYVIWTCSFLCIQLLKLNIFKLPYKQLHFVPTRLRRIYFPVYFTSVFKLRYPMTSSSVFIRSIDWLFPSLDGTNSPIETPILTVYRNRNTVGYFSTKSLAVISNFL
jgi:hypothetical protein